MDNFSKITEVELTYRSPTKASERVRVVSSKIAHRIFLETWDMNKIELQEQFRVMFIDGNNSCMGVATVATGGVTTCFVDLKLVFAMALKVNASGIILAHNHPSGSLRPSRADQTLTGQFIAAGKILDMAVIDHLIVTREGYKSLSDDGLMS